MLDTFSVVVTGTGKGIGRAIAEHLTAQGWIVIGIERSRGSGSRETGACHDIILGDTSDREVHQRAGRLAQESAPLKGWVNNAGITKRTPLHGVDESVVREIVNTNGFGYLWGSAAALDAFLDQEIAGSIVNIGSIHGRVSFPDFAAYEFTKGGIDALSRSIAVSYGAVGIRANTLALGAVRTPHLENFIRSAPDPQQLEASLTGGSPMRRFATAEEAAKATAFLLSDDSSYLSGESIALDGGWTASSGVGELDERIRERLFRGKEGS